MLCANEPTFEPLPELDLRKPRCDSFSEPLEGVWRDDGDIARRVDFLECPLISSTYACRWLGLPHADAPARMRFSPHHCHLEPFCASRLERALGARKLVMLGD